MVMQEVCLVSLTCFQGSAFNIIFIFTSILAMQVSLSAPGLEAKGEGGKEDIIILRVTNWVYSMCLRACTKHFYANI